MRRFGALIGAALLVAGCHDAATQEAGGDEPVNYAPPSADPTPTPIRTVDNGVIRDLAAGKTEGVVLIDLRHEPAALRPTIAAEQVELAACRRSRDDDAASACRRHDALVAELKAHRLCWGPDGEEAADRHWVHQGAGCRGDAR